MTIQLVEDPVQLISVFAKFFKENPDQPFYQNEVHLDTIILFYRYLQIYFFF